MQFIKQLLLDILLYDRALKSTILIVVFAIQTCAWRIAYFAILKTLTVFFQAFRVLAIALYILRWFIIVIGIIDLGSVTLNFLLFGLLFSKGFDLLDILAIILTPHTVTKFITISLILKAVTIQLETAGVFTIAIRSQDRYTWYFLNLWLFLLHIFNHKIWHYYQGLVQCNIKILIRILCLKLLLKNVCL